MNTRPTSSSSCPRDKCLGRMSFKKSAILSITTALSLYLQQANAGVAQNFQNTTTSQGDKCLACVLQKQYFCVGVNTKVADCYDSITDCMISPNKTTIANVNTLPSVPWATSPYECGVRDNTNSPAKAQNSLCMSTVSSTLDRPNGQFSVTLKRGEMCGIIFRNDLYQHIQYQLSI